MSEHLVFHPSSSRRRILIVDDEEINREMLGNILADQYDTLFAASGHEAIDIMKEYHDTLSLVLLDLIMPDMYGLDILNFKKSEERLASIPVIVVTSDKQAEVDSLNMGAIDFIPKPYPEPRVILARVQRTIELSEDRDIISYAERDSLTKLYNRDFFYHYAEQYDMFHKDTPMDAVVIDINHFHLINERYGKAYGDEILKLVGSRLREMVRKSGGTVCRREADTFLAYCPHRTDYYEIMEKVSEGLSVDSESGRRIRLRMGIYPDVDKDIDIERRFDRAKLAADAAKNDYTQSISTYDNKMHESEILAEQLIASFQAGIDRKQFEVYYQPKFDIRGSLPVLSSAEALVRWFHPTLGMVSPGIFIPLFEQNGLIRILDNYVWRETAAQISEWKSRLGVSVPVSVNVSRVDIIDTDMIDSLMNIVKEYGIKPEDLLLEITESAYTEDAETIIENVNMLRAAGFRVEMDDFGTGYSSLNMISSLPIDALKLDLLFIRHAFSERKDTRMLEVIIDIADSLGVPTIAEGVETAEQMFTLKTMGCDIVQGYYFSKPIPAAEYESFLIEYRDMENAEEREAAAAQRFSRESRRKDRSEKARHQKNAYDALHDPVTGLYNTSAFETLFSDTDQLHSALMILSLGGFKEYVATYDTEAGNKILRNTAEILRRCFRSVDYLFRISGDEFIVIMTRVDSSMQQLLLDKFDQVNAFFQSGEFDTRNFTISAGAAFGDRNAPEGDLFYDADTALIQAQEAGKSVCVIY